MVQAGIADRSDRRWAAAVHASALIGFLIPLGNVLAPLVLWLFARRRSAFVDEQGREALNFHLSIVLYAVIGGVLILLPVGLVILIATAAMMLIVPIVASVQGARGKEFHYPAAIGFMPWNSEAASTPSGKGSAA
ncbi:MAG: DUF4870 domain-containing protein [Thermaerobacter sp.]|nr:DUF4870 domain-containing protein [Thermaerobacter sp.]